MGNPVTDVTVIPQRKAPSSQSPTQQAKRTAVGEAGQQDLAALSFFFREGVYNSPGTRNLNLPIGSD